MNSTKPIKIFLAILSTVIIFHICILLKIIPYDITWGGRLTNDNEMYVFESISILINVLLCWLLLMKGKFIDYKISEKIVNVILWIFFGIFVLNTIGNIFAKTTFEKSFAFLTAISAILLWKIQSKELGARSKE
jgi:hypothetical protein